MLTRSRSTYDVWPITSGSPPGPRRRDNQNNFENREQDFALSGESVPPCQPPVCFRVWVGLTKGISGRSDEALEDV